MGAACVRCDAPYGEEYLYCIRCGTPIWEHLDREAKRAEQEAKDRARKVQLKEEKRKAAAQKRFDIISDAVIGFFVVLIGIGLIYLLIKIVKLGWLFVKWAWMN